MLSRWNSENDMLRLARQFDTLFDWPGSPSSSAAASFVPAVDIQETVDHFVIHADMPGMEEKDIEVSLEDGVLTLSGTRQWTHQTQDENQRVRERRHGSFHRQFRLSQRIVSEKIEATYKNGVLTLLLPKREEIKPRQIQVKSA